MRILTQIGKAFRKNLLPGCVLWCFGLLLITGYFYVDAINSILDVTADLKETYGFLFSAVSMGLFGGLIPANVALTMGRIPKHRRFRDTVFFTLFWAFMGVEIDLLYRIQAACFGSGSDFVTLTLKTVVDQFVYMPLIATVPLLILYHWKDMDYLLAPTIDSLKCRAFWAKTPLVIFSCWIVWIPAVYMIYWFPSSLQLAIANLIECFWALMLLVLTTSSVDESTSERRTDMQLAEESAS
jgi:hypothetical protein